MKTALIAVVLLGLATISRAADPEGFGLWKSDAIQKSGQELTGKIDEQKFAFQQLGNYDNHMIGISHREGRWQRRDARGAGGYLDCRIGRSHAGARSEYR